MSASSVKSLIRSKMKVKLSMLSKEVMEQQSVYITEYVIKMPEFVNSQRIGLYVSMVEEVNTDKLVRHLLSVGKECFIPRYNASTMEMVKLKSIEDYDNLPRNKWNIRQPLMKEDRELAYTNGGLDLILTPGLAFTGNGKRLGRGKGYYDRYLKKMKSYRKSLGNDLVTIGLAFTEQILDDIPITETDFILDNVVYKK